jgi:HNH endonuclease
LTWFKIDDKLHGHPKWTRCTSDAKALWTTVGSWCASYRTDGIVHDHDLVTLAAQTGLTPLKARRAAENLVENDMWQDMGDGWSFHHWTDFNPTRSQQKITEQVEKERRAVHRDTVLKAAVRLRDDDRCCFCDELVQFSNRSGQLGGQFDHTIPLTKGGRTTLDNVRVICRYHNQTKAGKLLEDLPEDFPYLLEPYTWRHPAERGVTSELLRSQLASRVGTGRGEVTPDRWLESVPHPADGDYPFEGVWSEGETA